MEKEVFGIVDGFPIATVTKVGHTLYLCGQLGEDLATGKVVGSDIATQTRVAIENLQTELQKANSDLSKVDAVTIHLARREDFDAMNKVYAQFFMENPPVRTTVLAPPINPDFLIEITAIAHV